MSFARRSVPTARQLLRNKQPRRFGSHAAHDHHAEPVNEGVGRSFYVTIGSFASAYVLYRLSKSNQESNSKSWISGLIEKWSPSEKTFEHRNAVHTAAMEKAAHDRHLFLSQGPREHFELRAPDTSFAPGSPFCVPAGSSVDLSHVKAHYEKENQAAEEARIARAQANRPVNIHN